MMPAGLSNIEMTNGERQEYLLGVIACALTGKRSHQIFPWLRSDLNG
jgi:hypothetical protein